MVCQVGGNAAVISITKTAKVQEELFGYIRSQQLDYSPKPRLAIPPEFFSLHQLNIKLIILDILVR